MKTTRILAIAALIVERPGADTWRSRSSRASRAPISCGTIWASRDARSSRCASISPPGWRSPAQPSGRRDRLRHRRPAGVPGRGQAAGDAQGRRGPVHPRRNDPRGEERRQRQRGGARHVHRRKREAARRAGSGERPVGDRRRRIERTKTTRKETVMSQLDAVIERDVAPSAGTVDMKLEVVVIPVSDVDRAKRFYGDLGWRLDADFVVDDGFGSSSSRLRARHARSTSAPGSRRPCRARHVDFISSCPTSSQPAPTPRPRRRRERIVPPCRSGKPPSAVRIRRGAVTSLRHVQRPGRQRMAVAGGHRAVPGPDRPERDELRLRIGSGERDAARVGGPRRARDAHGRPAG